MAQTSLIKILGISFHIQLPRSVDTEAFALASEGGGIKLLFSKHQSFKKLYHVYCMTIYGAKHTKENCNN